MEKKSNFLVYIPKLEKHSESLGKRLIQDGYSSLGSIAASGRADGSYIVSVPNIKETEVVNVVNKIVGPIESSKDLTALIVKTNRQKTNLDYLDSDVFGFLKKIKEDNTLGYKHVNIKSSNVSEDSIKFNKYSLTK